MGIIEPDISSGHLAIGKYYEQRIDPLLLPRRFYETHLKSLELLPNQIENQSLEDLDKSLETVNNAIENVGSYGTLKIKINSEGTTAIAKQDSDYSYEVSILPLLLESKKNILNRKKLLMSNQKIESLNALVENTKNPVELKEKIKSQLGTEEIKVIDDQLKETQRKQLSLQASEEFVRMQLNLQSFERRTAVIHSFLERESVATIIGAFLLLIITASILVSMFLNIKPLDIVNNAFLLILGYFFGQTISKTTTK